jgi:hypothetical protein
LNILAEKYFVCLKFVLRRKTNLGRRRLFSAKRRPVAPYFEGISSHLATTIETLKL